MRAACFVGDDAGDLAAFDALDDLAATGVAVVRVAVTSAEAPAELLRRADLAVDGPAAVVELLRSLCARRPAASCSSSQSWGVRAVAAARRVAARAARSAAGIDRAAWSASAVPTTSKGLTRSAPASPSSAQAPASVESTSTPSAVLRATPSLATRLRPSRTGLTSSTSARWRAATERGKSSPSS